MFTYIFLLLSFIVFCWFWFVCTLLFSLSLFCFDSISLLQIRLSHPQHPSFSFHSSVSLSPSLFWPLHSANFYNSIVPSLPVGSDGINKAGFEIDFLSAPFWITLLCGFGSEHSSSSFSTISQNKFTLYSFWSRSRPTLLSMEDVTVLESFYM